MTHPYNKVAGEWRTSATDPLGQLPGIGGESAPPTKRQVPDELDALRFAVDQCETLVSLLESRLAPFCTDIECGSAIPATVRDGKPLCAAATCVREARTAMERLEERLRELNVCLEI